MWTDLQARLQRLSGGFRVCGWVTPGPILDLLLYVKRGNIPEPRSPEWSMYLYLIPVDTIELVARNAAPFHAKDEVWKAIEFGETGWCISQSSMQILTRLEFPCMERVEASFNTWPRELISLIVEYIVVPVTEREVRRRMRYREIVIIVDEPKDSDELDGGKVKFMTGIESFGEDQSYTTCRRLPI